MDTMRLDRKTRTFIARSEGQEIGRARVVAQKLGIEQQVLPTNPISLADERDWQ